MIESYHGHLKMDYLWTGASPAVRGDSGSPGDIPAPLQRGAATLLVELSPANGVREVDEGGSMTGAGPMAEPPSPRTPHPMQTGGVHAKPYGEG